MEQLTKFQSYTSATEIELVAALLNEHGILTEIIKAAPQYVTYISGSLNNTDTYVLSIPADEFERANKIISDNTLSDVDSIEADHPLNAMTNEELRDILAKPDEWGADNYRVAIAILTGRGLAFSAYELDRLKDERFAKLSEKKTMNPIIIFLGYFMGCLPALIYIFSKMGYPALAVLGSLGIFSEFLWFLGIIVSFVILGSKTTLPDGTRTQTYDKASKYHGLAILAIYSITVLTILIYQATTAAEIQF